MGQPGTVLDQRCPKKRENPVQCVKLQSSYKNESKIPEGLIGSRCTAEVVIAGCKCQALLDTGSQVTTIPISFYNENLSSQPVHPLNELLHVEGAAGQSIPYLGYVNTTVIFPEDFLGSTFSVPTLALITPDVRPGFPSSILVGMNTLEVLYDQFQQSDSVFQPSSHGFRTVLHTLKLTCHRNSDNIGVVTLLSKTPVLVPAGHTVVVEGSAKVFAPTSQYAVIQHPDSGLPGGLCVSSCLVALPTRSPNKLPVVISNRSEQDTFIPALSIVAELGAYGCILSEHKVTRPSAEQFSQLDVDFGDSPIPSEWKRRIKAKLNLMSDVFSSHDLDFGCTSRVKHHIHLHDNTPFKHRARPIHPKDIEAVRKHLRELLDAGVIRESESSFSSPIVVVKKKNGDIRLCIDYRKLNLQTVKDAYALPNLEESFSALTGSKWFSVLDLKSGYYQIEMDEADKHKTAFVTPLGFWEFNRMPQGVTNAPSTFQRLMEKCMGDLHLKEVLVFLDDLIIFSSTLEEHENRLLRVLSRLREFGLKLSPDKCKFFQTSVRYLGHVVSEKGVETDPEKIAALKSWPVPTNLKTLKSFLGFSGYYRRFLKGYAAIAKPLNNLTRGHSPHLKIKGCGSSITQHDSKASFGSRWTPECQEAFETLIDKLTSAPVLGFADPALPYILHTDASNTGLGAALYQQQEGKLRVIAYASRGLSASESNYPAHKLEFLALKWSVTEKFQDYLYGADFTVVTDNNPLTYVLTSAKLDATSHRWLAALSTFSFKLQYRAGKQNLDADALSRRPHDRSSVDSVTPKDDYLKQLTEKHFINQDDNMISSEITNAICQSCLIRTLTPSTLIQSLSVNVDVLPDTYTGDSYDLPIITELSQLDLQEKQKTDPSLCEVIRQMETGEKILPSLRHDLPELPLLLRELSRLELINGVLYRKRQENERTSYQLMLPEELRPFVMQSLHNDMGHMGVERTLDLVRTRFYWPRMAADVEHKVKTCERCVRRKALPEKAAPLVNIQTSRPLELICMDFLSIEPDSSNTKDVLVVTDHFTKFAVAIPTPNQKARTVAKCLWENFIVYYGIPERLHTDQGTDFESNLIKELCAVSGIRKGRTTPYHPRGNPVERFNQTLLNMLGTLESKQKSKWKDHIKPLVHAYNCTKNEVTGFAPYELMFGRSPRLPVDLAFGLPIQKDKSQSHSQYVQDLKDRLKESFYIASKNAAKNAERNKIKFDQHVVPSKLEVGDRVLVRNVRVRGKHKLSDKWEEDVFVVIKCAGDLPVYTVRPESKDGPIRTLHRDLLLPCGFLPAAKKPEITVSEPVKRQEHQINISPEDSVGEDNPLDEPLLLIHDPQPVRFQMTKQFEVLKPSSSSAEIGLLPVEPASKRGSPGIGVDLDMDQRLFASNGEEDCVTQGEEDKSGDLSASLSPPPDAADKPSPEPNFNEPPPLDISSTDVMSSRPVRQRGPPTRLCYESLGNPLISAVQTFLHGVSDALSHPLSSRSPVRVV